MNLQKLNKQMTSWDELLWSKLNLEAIGRIIIENRTWLIFLWVMAITAHAFDLFNFTLSIDDELHAQKSGPTLAWAQQSRWGMYLLNWFVLPDTVFPFVPMMIAVTFTALSTYFTMKLLGNKREGADYVAAALFITCPTLYFVFAFETLGYGIGIGWFTCTLALHLFFFETGWKKYSAILLLAFSYGIYQAFILAVATLFQLYLISIILQACFSKNQKQKISIKELVNKVFGFTVLVGCSLFLYWLINELSFYYYALSKNDYLVNFVDIQWNLEYFKNAWEGIQKSYTGYYYGQSDFYATDIKELSWLLRLSIAIIILAFLFSTAAYSLRLLGMGLVLTTLLTPFMMNFMNGGFMPARALLGLPLVMAGLPYLATKVPFRLLKMVIISLMAIVAFRFVVANNQLAFSEYMTRQSDRELLSKIMLRAGDVVHEFSDNPNTHRTPRPMVLVGYYRHYSGPIMFERNSVGSSFFSWSGGDIRRIVALLRIMGINDYRSGTMEERYKVFDYSFDMPAWPDKGSVAVHEDILIVKMSKYVAPQLRALCREKDDNLRCERYNRCLKESLLTYCEQAVDLNKEI